MKEFTKDNFDIMKKKNIDTIRYSNYYLQMYNETGTTTYLNKFERLQQCLNYWEWDVYSKNKLLDLKRVNRCKDNRFCPNCRRVDLAIALAKFSPKYKEMLERGYYPYLLTLTTPNVKDYELEKEIGHFSKAFTKFWGWIYKNKKNRYKNCYITAKACIRVLEITYNLCKDTYNPHYHCIVFLNDDVSNYEKYICGPFRKKSNSYLKFSDLDIQLMRLWYLAINNLSIINYDTLPNGWYDSDNNYTGLYLVDLQPINGVKGIFEVFKYTFKDSDIVNYKVFCDIYDAIYKKRIRQGYGELYNLKLEESDDLQKDESIKDFLEIDKEETPDTIKIFGLDKTRQELFSVYQDFVKISRFRVKEIIDQLD